jgi:hypothetical protein
VGTGRIVESLGLHMMIKALAPLWPPVEEPKTLEEAEVWEALDAASKGANERLHKYESDQRRHLSRTLSLRLHWP